MVSTSNRNLLKKSNCADIYQFIIVVWWFVDAHKWFKGPKVNLEHLMHGRDEQALQIAAESDVIVGKDEAGERSSGSDSGIHGHLPGGKQVGDVKADRL